MILPLGVVFYKLATPTPKFQIDLPEPNGFNDLAQAGALLQSVVEPDDIETATTEQLRAFLAECSGAYEAARRGLSRKCRVPIKYSLEDDLMNIQNRRGLARAFVAEGELAEREGRTQDAIASYLDAARLGHAGACGGLGIDALVGFAVEGMAVHELHEIRDSLTPRQCRDTIDQLQRIADDWEPIEEFLVRDSIWCEHVFRWQSRLASMTSSTENDWRWVEPLNKARRRLLICELALQAYRAEHGEFPETLRDLAPEYLPAIPDDPFSGSPLDLSPHFHRLLDLQRRAQRQR